MRRAFLLPLFATFLACAVGSTCDKWRGPKTVRAVNGQLLCAKHHVPVISVRAYRAPKDSEIDPIYGYIIAAPCYPNHIPVRVSLHFAPQYFDEPITIQYCPRCERELQKEADRLESH